jgi:hypothetical protein
MLHSIPAQIKRKTLDEKETIDGQLLSLARSGAKVSACACLQFAEEISLQISIAPLGLHIELDAKVCWIRPADNHQWLIGCSFSAALSDESIDRLAVSGVIERRQHTRRPVNVAATAKWQLQEESFPVALRQYSFGGFCLACQQAPQLDQGVQVLITTSNRETYRISGRVRWHLEQDGEHLVGCTFSAGEDFPHLLEAAEKMRVSGQNKELATPTSLHRHWSWPQLAATIVIGSALGAATIPYWTTYWPPDNRIASLDENASLSEPVSPPPVRTSSHEDIRNEIRPALAPRSSLPPWGHDGTSSDVQRQPQKSPEEVAARGNGPRPSDSLANSITPPPSGNTTDWPTLPERSDIPTGSLPAAGVEEKPTARRDSMDLDSGLGERIGEHVDVAMTEEPLAEPAPSARDNPNGRSQQMAPAPADAEVNQAKEAFVRGTQFYRRGDYPKAIDEFRMAAKKDPHKALYFYVLAMSQFQANDLEQAEQNIEIAITLEKGEPIDNWGFLLSRYQGKSRVWVESRRAAAHTNVGG